MQHNEKLCENSTYTVIISSKDSFREEDEDLVLREKMIILADEVEDYNEHCIS